MEMDHHPGGSHGMGTKVEAPHPHSPSFPPPSSTTTNMQAMHRRMTFFWGKDVEVLFSGFPGDRGLGPYLLSISLVLLAALLVEALSATSRRLLSLSSSSVASGLIQSTIHAVRVALAYLVMLAAMSFNGGIFLAAVVGHALGFLLFSSSASPLVRTPAAAAEKP